MWCGWWWWCGLASPEVGNGSEGATDASADAGMVPVPMAATMAVSACCSSHCTVSPSDLLELRLLPPLPGLRHHLQLLLLLLPSAAPVLLRRLVDLDLQVVLRRLLLVVVLRIQLLLLLRGRGGGGGLRFV